MPTDDTRTRILNAAGPVFAEKGFADATIRDICQAADVNVASVNYHFGDKEQLYVETVTRAAELIVEQVNLPTWSPETSPADKLRDYVRTKLTRMLGTQSAPWQTKLMMREVLQPTAACKTLVKDYFRPDFNLLVGILKEILPPGTPPFQFHQIGFSILGQCLHYRVVGDVVALIIDEQELRDHYGVTQLADHIIDFSLAALGLAPPLSDPARADVRRDSRRVNAPQPSAIQRGIAASST